MVRLQVSLSFSCLWGEGCPTVTETVIPGMCSAPVERSGPSACKTVFLAQVQLKDAEIQDFSEHLEETKGMDA